MLNSRVIKRSTPRGTVTTLLFPSFFIPPFLVVFVAILYDEMGMKLVASREYVCRTALPSLKHTFND